MNLLNNTASYDYSNVKFDQGGTPLILANMGISRSSANIIRKYFIVSCYGFMIVIISLTALNMLVDLRGIYNFQTYGNGKMMIVRENVRIFGQGIGDKIKLVFSNNNDGEQYIDLNIPSEVDGELSQNIKLVDDDIDNYYSPMIILDAEIERRKIIDKRYWNKVSRTQRGTHDGNYVREIGEIYQRCDDYHKMVSGKIFSVEKIPSNLTSNSNTSDVNPSPKMIKLMANLTLNSKMMTKGFLQYFFNTADKQVAKQTNLYSICDVENSIFPCIMINSSLIKFTNQIPKILQEGDSMDYNVRGNLIESITNKTFACFVLSRWNPQ